MKYLGRFAEIDQNPVKVVLFAGLIGFAIKILLSASTVGTNDVASWAFYTNYVLTDGSVSIYREIPLYNHPPLVSGYLWFIGRVLGGQESVLFPFLLRLPSIVADFGSLWLVWRLTDAYYGDRRALWATLTFALSPTLILVSGFHGNSDPVFLFLMLWSLYLLVIERSTVGAGLLLGLAVNIKIVPLMLVPAFFFLIRGMEGRLRFFGGMGLTLVAGYGYHLSRDFRHLITNIFSYQGFPGIWGIGMVFEPYDAFGRLAMEIVIIVMMAFLGWRMESVDDDADRSRKLLEAYSVTFLAALVLFPGFGVQYLAWLVPVFCFVSPLAAASYSLVSGLFLLMVYHHWSGGFPLYYANSFVAGEWSILVSGLGAVLWLSLCVVLIVYSFRMYRLPGQGSQ